MFVTPYLLSRYFGLKHLGLLYGWSWTAYATAAAFGSIILGRAFDRNGGYTSMLLIFSGATFLGGLLMLAMPKYGGVVESPELAAKPPVLSFSSDVVALCGTEQLVCLDHVNQNERPFKRRARSARCPSRSSLLRRSGRSSRSSLQGWALPIYGAMICPLPNW